jgi:hypothetical protein
MRGHLVKVMVPNRTGNTVRLSSSRGETGYNPFVLRDNPQLTWPYLDLVAYAQSRARRYNARKGVGHTSKDVLA